MKSKKASTGKLLIQGIASGPLIDKDNERFDEKAVQKMANQINESVKPLRAEHQDKFYTNIGTWKSASLDDTFTLHVEGEVDTELSLGKDVEVKLNRGEQIGLSVGGRVVSAVSEYVKELGKTIKVYKDVILDEISIVENPAYAAAEVSLAKSINWNGVQKSNGQAEIKPSTEGKKLITLYKERQQLNEADFLKKVQIAKSNASRTIEDLTKDISELIKNGDINGVIKYFNDVKEMNNVDKRRLVDRTMLTMKTLVDNRYKMQPKLFSDYFNNLYTAMKNALTKSDAELAKEFAEKTGIKLEDTDLEKFKHAYEYMQGLRKDYPNGFNYSQTERAAKSFEKIVLSKSASFIEGSSISGIDKLTKAYEEIVKPRFSKGYYDEEVYGPSSSPGLHYSQHFANVTEAIEVLTAIKERYAEIKEKLEMEQLESEKEWLEERLEDLLSRREAVEAQIARERAEATDGEEKAHAANVAEAEKIVSEKSESATQRHDVPQDDAKGSNTQNVDNRTKKNNENNDVQDEEETTAAKGEKPKQRHDTTQDDAKGSNSGKKTPVKKESAEEDDDDDGEEHPAKCKCTDCKKARKAAKDKKCNCTDTAKCTHKTTKSLSSNQNSMENTQKNATVKKEEQNAQATPGEQTPADNSPTNSAPVEEVKPDEQTSPSVPAPEAAPVEAQPAATETAPEAPATETPSTEAIEKSMEKNFVKAKDFQKFEASFNKFSTALENLTGVIENVEKRLEKAESSSARLAQVEDTLTKTATVLKTISEASLGRRSFASAFQVVPRESSDVAPVEKSTKEPSDPVAKAMDSGEDFQTAYKKNR